MSGPNHLFASSDLRTDLENHEGRMLEQIRSIDPDEFLKTSPDDLAELLLDEFTVDVPVLRAGEDDISVTQRETQVDVTQDRGRAILDRSARSS